jgi:ketosteroid isomerase-like protein
VGSQENRALIESWYHALEDMDFQALEDLHAEDVIYNIVGTTPVSGRWVGKEECFAEVINNRLMAALVPEKARFGKKWRIMCADDDCVVGLMQGGGPTIDGELYEQTYCEIFTIRDGKIAELHEFLDTVLVERCLNDNRLEKPETPQQRPFEF